VTDTYIGLQTAKIIQKWLGRHFRNVQIKQFSDLQTSDYEAFRVALSDMAKNLIDETETYRHAQYGIIFNLTGGFKAVQGFLQTLGMFLADETIYVFESSNELMRIPRLPIKLDFASPVKESLSIIRRLDKGLSCSDHYGIPDIMLMKIGNETALSEWGTLIWRQMKKEIYEECLHNPPSDKILFGNNFLDTIRGLDKTKIYELNNKMDDLALYLEKCQDIKSLDLKLLKSRSYLPSTHELDAWHDGNAKRIFAHYKNNGIIVLDKLHKALH